MIRRNQTNDKPGEAFTPIHYKLKWKYLDNTTFPLDPSTHLSSDGDPITFRSVA